MRSYLTCSEDLLIEGCQQKYRKAQRALYERFSGKLYAICLRYAKNTHDADDILQKSFIKVFEHIDQLEEKGALEGWLRKIVVNTALKEYRRKLDQMHKEEVTDLNYSNTVTNLTMSHLSYQELLKLIHQLPEQCRLVFNLVAIEGYKHREVAEMLDIADGTSKSQYSRARSLLQEMIATEEERYVRQIIR